jgi:hypothetical protein
MSQHWVPEDDAATGGRPRLDDDTEGHIVHQEEQPGATAGEQPDFRTAHQDDDTEGHRQFDEQFGLRASQEEPGFRPLGSEDDDAEGHLRVAGNEPGMRAQDEDDTEGHLRFAASEPGMREQDDQGDAEGPGFRAF